MTIPLLDLAAQHAVIRPELDAAIDGVITSSAFISGPYVSAFNREFAAYCGAQHAIGVSNGTHAISLALKGFGIGRGDEVITVPQTFIATAEAISAVGATVRFVDVEPRTVTMDHDALASAITARTKAIIPVHLYGQSADMRAIGTIAKAHGLKVLGDAAQAHGATFDGEPIARWADATSFSFYPGKNLGAFGDAGAVVTDDAALAKFVAMASDHGRTSKYAHDFEGENCRMDGMQAAILSVKLRHLESWTERRRALAATYTGLLADVPGLTLPYERPGSRAVFHLYVVRTARRDALREHLQRQGISTGVHYPIPLHRQQAYAYLGLGDGSFPESERVSRDAVSLPLFPEMTTAQQERVVTEVAGFMRSA